MLLDMPFDVVRSEKRLKSMDLEHIMRTFKKPWKDGRFHMNRFSLKQETFSSHHPDYEHMYNDGNHTIRLFYHGLPIASIGAVNDNDDFIGILQIQGTRYEDDIGLELGGYLGPSEQSKIRGVLESFYWSHALLSIMADNLFAMGVDDVRVVSFGSNPNNHNRHNALDDIDDVHKAIVTYDLTALTLGFSPMVCKKDFPRGISSNDVPLSFSKEGHPNKEVTFYYMLRKEYEGGVIDTLMNGDGKASKNFLKNIHACLGNYRQKDIGFNLYVENRRCVSNPISTEKTF